MSLLGRVDAGDFPIQVTVTGSRREGPYRTTWKTWARSVRRSIDLEEDDKIYVRDGGELSWVGQEDDRDYETKVRRAR